MVGEWVVRRYVGHSDRLIVLEDGGGSASPRRGMYDDYVGNRESLPAEPEVPQLEVGPPDSEFRECPSCERNIRYNLRRSHFYSHLLPGQTEHCAMSGR